MWSGSGWLVERRLRQRLCEAQQQSHCGVPTGQKQRGEVVKLARPDPVQSCHPWLGLEVFILGVLSKGMTSSVVLKVALTAGMSRGCVWSHVEDAEATKDWKQQRAELRAIPFCHQKLQRWEALWGRESFSPAP